MTTVYLIRHSLKMEGPVSGKNTIFDHMQPLSTQGEERARQLLDIAELRGADFAVASTMSRSLATIRYLIEADRVSYDIDDRLREMEFGSQPGKKPERPRSDGTYAPGTKPEGPRPDGGSMGDFRARQWVDQDLRPEDGESVAQCRRRMTDAVLQAVREHPEQKILVGSHGAAICAYLSGVIEGVDDDFVRTVNLPDVFRLTFDGDTVTDCTRLDLPFPLPPHPGDKGGPPTHQHS